MAGGLSKLKERFLKLGNEQLDYPEELAEDYIEIETDKDAKSKAKIMVRPFVISDFEGVKPALDALREGYTIALLNIKPLKDRDILELKRAVNRIKKTCDAIEGDIAGIGEDWIVVTPAFAQIHRSQQVTNPAEQV